MRCGCVCASVYGTVQYSETCVRDCEKRGGNGGQSARNGCRCHVEQILNARLIRALPLRKHCRVPSASRSNTRKCCASVASRRVRATLSRPSRVASPRCCAPVRAAATLWRRWRPRRWSRAERSGGEQRWLELRRGRDGRSVANGRRASPTSASCARGTPGRHGSARPTPTVASCIPGAANLVPQPRADAAAAPLL